MSPKGENNKIKQKMAQFIKIYPDKPNEAAIAKVVKVLRDGGLVIYPTDTVYGLGCDITNTKALERIAKIKGIKLDKANFSFICNDLSNISDYVRQIDTATFKLLKKALPGPYTFILPGNNNLPKEFKKKTTVGIRVPDNSIALEIVRQLGNPIVSTSIRDDDDVIEYTTDPELIFEKWQNLVDLVIDGGYGDNVGSTIIDLSGDEPVVVREGKGSLDIL
jgi:tRNA threonylcarbamoyl adenosine modification protein (Sua5/YciO/YrdC/YwlC family)